MKFWSCLVPLLWTAAGARADEFTSNGVKVAYTVQGSGSPVLLIHGFLGSGALNWTLPGITTALAKKHRVIVIDVRGHGTSGKPSAEADYGVKMVGDVIALLDHLDVRKVHLAGYSMGGMIALKTAVMHPERVQSLLLCGMGWLQEGGAMQQFWIRTKNPCSASFARLAVTQAEVRDLKIPATIIVGDKDPVDRFYVAPLTQIRRDWPVTKIAGAGHITCIIKPEFREAVVNAVAKFDGKAQR